MEPLQEAQRRQMGYNRRIAFCRLRKRSLVAMPSTKVCHLATELVLDINVPEIPGPNNDRLG